MTRSEIPESDWVDPERWQPGEQETPPDAPEADAAEQSRPLRPDEEATPTVDREVDEYDAVEQSRVVVQDDEYDR